MNRGIRFQKIWSDKEVIQFWIDSCDGDSLFSSEVYIGHQDLADLIEGLNTFKDQVHGGIYDFQLGAFGPEFANGAFQARFHFQIRGKIYITINAQSDFREFGIKTVASEATIYLISEPALLDNFIVELEALRDGSAIEAHLEAVIA